MKINKLLLFFTFFLCFTVSANDGAYYISGNQLIPIKETDISVKKEILTIKRLLNSSDQVLVDVYYEFHNPGKQKKVTVGFEASAPSGDADFRPKNGEHPYMEKFVVNINGNHLPYKVSVVNAEYYQRTKTIKELTNKEKQEEFSEYNGDTSAMYVYHIDVDFKPGINVIKHSYVCDMSGSIDFSFSFDYVLSAAGRWANKQIDDFTLNIDMGENACFSLLNTFFANRNEWKIEGLGKSFTEKTSHNPRYEDYFVTNFILHNGKISYQKKNFKPKDELYIFLTHSFDFDSQTFDYREDTISFSFWDNLASDRVNEHFWKEIFPKDEMSRRVLKNLPFAIRGYVFSDPILQTYYEKMKWYLINPDYKPEQSTFSETEKDWIRFWEKGFK